LRSIWKYQQLLSTLSSDHRILLGEGQTPLIKSKFIGRKLGIPELYFKLENLNPSGSYKDRFAAMFVSILQSRSIPVCLATSSGNTGAALAAYCAAANIKCILAIVDGAPLAKVKQMQLYGASTYMIKDFGKNMNVTKEVFDFLESMASSMDIPLPISAYHYCPEGMEAVQTIAYEILEEMDSSVDHIFSPAGGGGLTLAIARGVHIYSSKNLLSGIPKVNCVQPEGNDTIASALRNKAGKATAVPFSATGISGLQVPNVLDGDAVIQECMRLDGNGYVVQDERVFEYQRILALHEGIFCEPAGAAALAGLAVAVENGEVKSNERVACLITGSGFKDMSSIDEHFKLQQPEKLANVYSLKQHITNHIQPSL
jgi:threonine synthase